MKKEELRKMNKLAREMGFARGIDQAVKELKDYKIKRKLKK